MTAVWVGVVAGFAGVFVGVLLMAIVAAGAREDRVRGEYLEFEDLGRERIGLQ